MIEFHLGEFVLSQKRFVLLKESQPEVFDKFVEWRRPRRPFCVDAYLCSNGESPLRQPLSF